MTPTLMAVVGPTASGKTPFAIELAARLDGEILSVDSRQVYRHCDIGTNKPTIDELRGLACHLIDVVDPDEAFTVGDYLPRARTALTAIWGRERIAVLQGGTGLYIRALFDGWNLADAPPEGDPTESGQQRLHADRSKQWCDRDAHRADREADREFVGRHRKTGRACRTHAPAAEPCRFVSVFKRPAERVGRGGVRLLELLDPLGQPLLAEKLRKTVEGINRVYKHLKPSRRNPLEGSPRR